MNEQAEEVVVIFRRWGKQNGESVIAIFPEIDAGQGHVMMYESIGQHSGGDYQLVMEKTKATEWDDPDVQALQKELESIGYRLRPRKRANWHTMRSKV